MTKPLKLNGLEILSATYSESSKMCYITEPLVNELRNELQSLKEENQILKDGVKEILKKDRLFNHDFNNDKIKTMLEVVENDRNNK